MSTTLAGYVLFSINGDQYTRLGSFATEAEAEAQIVYLTENAAEGKVSYAIMRERSYLTPEVQVTRKVKLSGRTLGMKRATADSLESGE